MRYNVTPASAATSTGLKHIHEVQQKELVDRIGLPREEFFIWGDDHEYRLRAEEAGARVATVVTATVRTSWGWRAPPPAGSSSDQP